MRKYEAVEIIDGKIKVYYDENGKIYFIEIL